MPQFQRLALLTSDKLQNAESLYKFKPTDTENETLTTEGQNSRVEKYRFQFMIASKSQPVSGKWSRGNQLGRQVHLRQ